MTPKEMIEAQAAKFEKKASDAEILSVAFERGRDLKGIAQCAGFIAAYRDAAESLRKLLALKGWE